MDNFEEGLQVELDKLPYEQHVDDGRYNDGKQAGFELGARWALEYIETLLPTEEEIKQDLADMGWLIGDDFPINEILEDIIIVIKSRLAGKEE